MFRFFHCEEVDFVFEFELLSYCVVVVGDGRCWFDIVVGVCFDSCNILVCVTPPLSYLTCVWFWEVRI